jgi:hypothetical protein
MAKQQTLEQKATAKKPTPEQEKMIRRALTDTLDAIKGEATTRFEGQGIKTAVLSDAEIRWNVRYYPMFAHAVVDLGLNWDDHKKLVLERAKQVGTIAANLASIKAVIFAWIRGDIGLPGQHVHVRDAPLPEITMGMAELASRCVDCKESKDDHPGIRWDWCSSVLSPPLPGVDLSRLSDPPTIHDLIKFLIGEVMSGEISKARRLSGQTDEV